MFDPLNLGTLSETIKGQSHGGLFPHAQWLREAEIKHGRMAMLAFVGTVAAVSGLSFPEVSEDVSNSSEHLVLRFFSL